MPCWRRLALVSAAALGLSQAASGADHDDSLPECTSCSPLDTLDEGVDLMIVPHTSDPQLHLARFDFNIEAQLSPAFRADQFDLFPKSIGKFLNAHQSLVAFEASLTQGRWKVEEWGAAPREFRPPGAVLAAAINSSQAQVVEDAWKFLISALSGSLCASFEGMDPAHSSSSWAQPVSVPWAAAGQEQRFSTLPYEAVCTENLTPWLKLLPCGGRRGLAALLAPLAVAESQFITLSLAAKVRDGSVQLQASLHMVLPLQSQRRGLAAWFGDGVGATFASCPAARRSSVRLLKAAGGPDKAGGDSLVELPSADFADLEGSAKEWPQLPGAMSTEVKPWLADAAAGGTGLSVMRDVLSVEGKSERTHGRYLLRFTNLGATRRLSFMDQLPFFLRPLWHTFHVTFQMPDGTREELQGVDAMWRVGLTFVPPGAPRRPTEVFLAVDVPPGGVVSVFLHVQKTFVQLREFSYACEKGFDVGSAAWLELELQDGQRAKAQSAEVSTADFVASLASEGRPGAAGRLRFTEGLLILVPMPDFSMPFNVIALSATAVTFFFGSLFRLTAAGRVPHWVLKKDTPAKRGFAFWAKRVLMVLIIGGLYQLHITEEAKLKELRGVLPEMVQKDVMATLEYLKSKLDDSFGSGGH